jgi:Rieske Fe-S protein
MLRRGFLKGACRICLLGSAGAALTDLIACSPAAGNTLHKPEVINNTIEVPANIFNSKILQVVVSPKNYPYEIAVQKTPDGNYTALLLQCTHYENQLMPAGKGFACNVHGSRFNGEGRVLKGPATAPLKQLTITKTGNNLIIQLLKLRS